MLVDVFTGRGGALRHRCRLPAAASASALRYGRSMKGISITGRRSASVSPKSRTSIPASRLRGGGGTARRIPRSSSPRSPAILQHPACPAMSLPSPSPRARHPPLRSRRSASSGRRGGGRGSRIARSHHERWRETSRFQVTPSRQTSLRRRRSVLICRRC